MPAGIQRRTDPLRSWARREAKDHSGLDALSFASAVASRVGEAVGLDLSGLDAPAIDLTEPPGGWASPWLVGVAHEQAATAGDRTSRGAWYTPRDVVEGLVELTIDSSGKAPNFVLDPTCGGGAFLLAALDHLVSMGVAPSDAMASVGGIDIDPGAVEAARLALSLWAHGHGCGIEPRVEQADALVEYPASWPNPDVIIGNPPFASPLRSDAVDDATNEFRNQREALFGPYADTAACHLARAVELVSDKGSICLIQPMSVLSGRDTEGLRAHLDEVAPTKALWCTRQSVFDAGVRVMAPILVAGGHRDLVTLATGPRPKPLPGRRPNAPWSHLAADALGVPAIRLNASGTLDELVQATAGFRDEHYGLAAVCVEQAESTSRLRLTTVGSIDPLFAWWGRRPTRFASRLWDRPVIEADRLDTKVGRWLEQQLHPKVILPTQSKIFEPLIDFDATLVPATPVLALHCDADRLHHVAAVLLAPSVVAWAARETFGAAMSIDALKMSARQIQQLPLPPGAEAWDRAAAILADARPDTPTAARETALSVAEIMLSAYNTPANVMSWYESRFPEPK